MRSFIKKLDASTKRAEVRGILIYQFYGVTVDDSFRWDDWMTMEVMTLNLYDSWKSIYGG